MSSIRVLLFVASFAFLLAYFVAQAEDLSAEEAQDVEDGLMEEAIDESTTLSAKKKKSKDKKKATKKQSGSGGKKKQGGKKGGKKNTVSVEGSLKKKKKKGSNQNAASISKKTPRNFFGMMVGSMNLELMFGNPGGLDFAAHFAGIGSTGVRVLRCGILWHRVEKQENVYDWAAADYFVALAAKNNLQCQPNLLGYPDYLPWPCEHNPMPEGGLVNGFAKWVAAVARRYGPAGNFWGEHPELPRKPFKIYEIWNEPNLYKDFACNTNSPTPYAYLLHESAKALKAADKNAKVMFGGLAPVGDDLGYLEQTFKANKKLKKLVDHVGYHPYAKKAVSAMRKLAALRESMTKVGLSTKKSLISLTEYGWLPLDADAATPSGACRGPQSDEALVTHEKEFVKLVTSKRTKLGVLNIMPFQWWTPPNDCINKQWGVIASGPTTLLPKGIAYVEAMKKALLKKPKKKPSN